MSKGFATRAIHSGQLPAPTELPLVTPIWQTSTFSFDDAEHYAHTLRQPREGFVYTRYENPTTAALEATVADLEGATEGLATASGMGAIATVLLSLAGTGDHLVAQRDLYGGTYSLLAHTAPRFGIEVTFADGGDPDAVRAALRPTTRAIYAETVANPTMTVADLPALAEVAASAGLPLVVDNTVASPYLCRPIEHGAAVVVHSATKYLGGHSDVVGGIALFADPERHAAAWHAMIELGASADPFAAWLVLRGVKTLALRMRGHGQNARLLAGLLAAHPKVARVWWPGLAEHPTAGLAAKLLDGDAGMLSFDLEGGRAAGRRFIEATTVAKLAPSLGSVETLVSHPASTTHRQFDAEALAAAGIAEGMVRVSVGLEDGPDLADDFSQALEVA
jgi:cystathionine beta-lyase/cystathionine gamma-synthase